MSLSRSAFSCENVPEGLVNAPIVTECDLVKSGALRLQTVFQYPDGSSVDVFLAPVDDLVHQYKITDYGQTATYLLDMPMDPWGTSKRKKIISEICRRLNVGVGDGEFYVMLRDKDVHGASGAIVRLAQACIRVSDLAMTKRFRAVSSFRDDVEEFVSQLDLPFATDEEIIGRFGNVVRVDFSVTGKVTKSLMQTLSTAHPSAAHQVANEVFTKWYDIEGSRDRCSFISVYNSDSTAFRDEDLRRLETVSTVLGFPAQADAISEAIAA